MHSRNHTNHRIVKITIGQPKLKLHRQSQLPLPGKANRNFNFATMSTTTLRADPKLEYRNEVELGLIEIA